jgi:thermitase
MRQRRLVSRTGSARKAVGSIGSFHAVLFAWVVVKTTRKQHHVVTRNISLFNAADTVSPSRVRHLTRCLAAAGLLAALGVSPTISAAAGPETAPADSYAKGRILVMPRPGLSDAELAKILSLHGGKARKIGATGIHIVDLPATASEQAVVEQLAHNPHFKFAELDRSVAPAFVANDTYYGNEWHIAKTGASTAWDTSQGAGVTIAILDTGVLGTHQDLAANMVPGWNVFNNNSDTSDFYGHGTPVAGTAAAITNNGTGVSGVAGKSKIMPLVITDSTFLSYYSVISQAITYAADHGARVASISFSGLAFSSAVQSASQYMKNKGGLVVVAAGNTGAVDNVTPTTTMIPVSATVSNDTLATWSTYGAFVALSAPGDGIYSTSRTSATTYGIYGGTSFATPVVAGTIALMMAANPSLSSTQIESLLYKTAVDLGSPGRDIYYGYGRVDAAAAVKAAAAATTTTTTTDTTPPSVAIAAPLSSSSVSGLVSVNVNASDNVGVTKVELRVNGALYATDTSGPFGFSWDSTKVANGMATLTAVAYDAAGHSATSAPISVNVANATTTIDTAPPVVQIVSPGSGAIKAKGSVSISTSASDNSGSAQVTQSLYVDGVLKATVTGSSLAYTWNLNKVASGSHTIKVVATDAAKNTSSASVQVTK